MNKLRPDRIRKVPTGPTNDEKIIAGYTDEALNGAIRDLSRVGRPGEWETNRLAALRAEKKRRDTPKVPARRPLDTRASKDG